MCNHALCRFSILTWLSVTEKDGSVVNYRYYLTYELAREERVGTSPYLIEYFYDAAGNHLRTVRDGVETTTYCDAANQITRKVGPNGTVNFAYDADGNLSSETAPDGSGKSYSFDGRDQLVSVEVKNAGGVLVHRSEFSYDGFGRLMKSSEFERNGTAWVKQSERGRVFDGLDTVQERSETNQVVVQLTRDGNIGGILSRKAGASAVFFGYDGNGNVTTLSDAQGNSVGHYRYDGFGNALEVTGSSASENAHRFSTKELHAPSGLYYYGFRFYSPALGRWINRDPIGELGGINLYRMVEGNPINKIDPFGLNPKPGDAEYDYFYDTYRGKPLPTMGFGLKSTPQKKGLPMIAVVGSFFAGIGTKNPTAKYVPGDRVFEDFVTGNPRIEEDVETALKSLRDPCKRFVGNHGPMGYSPRITQFAKDVFILPTAPTPLNPSWTTSAVGGWSGSWQITKVNNNYAILSFHIINPVSLTSLTRNPITRADGLPSRTSGPMATITQHFYWSKGYYFKDEK